MTKERIEDFREVVLPFVRKRLLETNYEGLGKSDAEEFAKDFDEILNLAIKALEQEPTPTDCETCIHNKGVLECDMYGCKYEPITKNDLGVDCISRADAIQIMQDTAKKLTNEDTINGLCGAVAILYEMPSVTPQEPRWIPTSKKLPNKNQWVLVTTEDYQKIAEVMCYQGIRIGKHDVGNGWEEYEYPSWTSGHGDIQSSHPKAWMPLPPCYEPQERNNKE